MEIGASILEMHQRVCTNCLHHFEGPTGLFCGLYKEEIAFDEVALDCEDFEYG